MSAETVFRDLTKVELVGVLGQIFRDDELGALQWVASYRAEVATEEREAISKRMHGALDRGDFKRYDQLDRLYVAAGERVRKAWSSRPSGLSIAHLDCRTTQRVSGTSRLACRGRSDAPNLDVRAPQRDQSGPANWVCGPRSPRRTLRRGRAPSRAPWHFRRILMPPIGTIASLLRDWLRWHQSRDLAQHTTKLAGERIVRELNKAIADRDPSVVKGLRLIDTLERLALSVKPTTPELRKLRSRTTELRQGMHL